MNNKLLIICGPTGVGKTKLAISLARELDAELISADSRQVYIGMTIGTGKEYSDDVSIWGYDLVAPNEEFSVSHFHSFASKKIVEIQKRNKLPILVGGTGLYIRSISGNLDSISIPPNPSLRKEYEKRSASDLFALLKEKNPTKAMSLNDSDQRNPRRLIRALEISYAPMSDSNRSVFNTLQIGLKSDVSYLQKRVEESIQKRLEMGFEKEVQTLIDNGYSFEEKSMTATGYREIGSYLRGEISRNEAIEKWTLSEKQYIKRQLTWFLKSEDIHWFDIQEKDYAKKVEEFVKTWHNNV